MRYGVGPSQEPRMPTALDALKAVTVVVADTGDFDSIQAFRPRDATTNPSLIAAAARMPRYAGVVDAALRWARETCGGGAPRAVAALAVDRLAVEFGMEILKIVPGRVSTEVDARLSFDVAASAAKARQLIAMYERAGVSRERVLVKLAATWEGIQAAAELEREGIHCNLTLLFGFHQAVACAEANVTLISPFVGRILDWYLKSTGRGAYPPPEDPGVLSVTEIYNYYKRHGYRTEVMGASFRNVGEILELAGCDLLTIAPKLLAELDALPGPVPRRLDPARASALGREKIHLERADFERLHAADAMAREKLAEGIQAFSKAIDELEAELERRVAAA